MSPSQTEAITRRRSVAAVNGPGVMLVFGHAFESHHAQQQLAKPGLMPPSWRVVQARRTQRMQPASDSDSELVSSHLVGEELALDDDAYRGHGQVVLVLRIRVQEAVIHGHNLTGDHHRGARSTIWVGVCE